uniref:Uncharacterized protein n=1 Tax=Wuchereria bancrofti TaxID=6293 RepID=A0AAF5RXG4_WUCBA
MKIHSMILQKRQAASGATATQQGATAATTTTQQEQYAQQQQLIQVQQDVQRGSQYVVHHQQQRGCIAYGQSVQQAIYVSRFSQQQLQYGRTTASATTTTAISSYTAVLTFDKLNYRI